MKRMPFILQVFSASQCVLRREEETWELQFTSVQEALAHARTIPDAEGAQVEVLNETGQRFMIVYV